MAVIRNAQKADAATPEKYSAKKGWTVALAVLFSVVIIDQIIKFYIKTHFALYEQHQITSWFSIDFIENKGMAFGMDFIGTLFLAIFRILAIALFFYWLSKVIRKKLPLGLVICVSMIIAGAAGNIIDNCFYGLIFTESQPFNFATSMPAHLVSFGNGYGAFFSGKVVDMFYFPLWVWPDWVPILGGEVFFNAIFNFADASITCGVIALFLFYSRFLLNSKSNTGSARK